MVSELFDFENKNYLITGSSRGIGEAVVRQLIDLGANVFGISRKKSNFEHPRFQQFPVDITNKAQLKEILVGLPPMDGVFLNAGASGTIKPFQLVSEEDAVGLFDLNFFAPYFLLQEMYKNKKLPTGTSVVVNTAHGAFYQAAASSIYCATKSALTSAFRSVALEFARRKIHINFVAFGYVDTELLRTNNVSEDSIKLVPLGCANPEQVSGSVLFLLSSASRWVTGTTLLVDGGLSLKQVKTL